MYCQSHIITLLNTPTLYINLDSCQDLWYHALELVHATLGGDNVTTIVVGVYKGPLEDSIKGLICRALRSNGVDFVEVDEEDFESCRGFCLYHNIGILYYPNEGLAPISKWTQLALHHA